MKTIHPALLSGTFLVAVGLVLAPAQHASALPVIADFTADYQTPTPKAGWSYMHNGAGVAIGSEGYTVNQYNASGNWYTTGGVNLPAAYPGGYSVVGSNFMHPGAGSTQYSDGLDHFTLAQYTVSHGGETLVTDLSASTVGGGTGTELWVNVNTGSDLVPVADRIISPGGSYLGPNTIDLGVLSAGDRIYVGIGPHGSDGNDSTTIQFQIQQAPEPTSLVLFGLGAAVLLVARCRRKA